MRRALAFLNRTGRAGYVGWLVAHRLAVLSCLVAFVAVGSSAASAAVFPITDLAGPRYDGYDVSGMNNGGQVVGFSLYGNYVHSRAFSYTPAGGLVDLGPPLYGGDSRADDMSDSGQIVGASATASGDMHAFSYTPAGGLIDLGTLPGGNYSDAAAVSDSGQIVGWSQTASGDMHAFSYTPAGGMIDLGALPGGLYNGASAVSRQIVGAAKTASGETHAFSYTAAGGMIDLGTLPGGNYSEASAVSDSGQIVGAAKTASGEAHAFSYTAAGGMIDLGTLPGGDYSGASAVSDGGQIVGSAKTASGAMHAFSYTRAGGMIDPGALPGWGFSQASAVNDRWQIAGTSAGDLVMWQLFSPPSVTITTPGSGLSFIQDEVVDAAYSCMAGQGASLSSCAGPVPSGQPIDTHTIRSHAFTVTATDNYGQSSSQTVNYTVAPKLLRAPVLSRVRQSTKSWREDNMLVQISAKRKRPPVGTTFSFTLNIRATVSFGFTQRATGRKVGGRCIAQSNKNDKRPRCTRTMTAGALSFTAHQGASKVRFAGRVTRTNELRPGNYTLRIIATNHNGNRSAPATLNFTIVK